eukprot:3758730-Rhodomonas_salina.1
MQSLRCYPPTQPHHASSRSTHSVSLAVNPSSAHTLFQFSCTAGFELTPTAFAESARRGQDKAGIQTLHAGREHRRRGGRGAARGCQGRCDIDAVDQSRGDRGDRAEWTAVGR